MNFKTRTDEQIIILPYNLGYIESITIGVKQKWEDYPSKKCTVWFTYNEFKEFIIECLQLLFVEEKEEKEG